MLGRPDAPNFWRIVGRDDAAHLALCIAGAIVGLGLIGAIGTLVAADAEGMTWTFGIVCGTAAVTIVLAAPWALWRTSRIGDLFLGGEPAAGTVRSVRRFRGQNAVQLPVENAFGRADREGWIALTDCESVAAFARPEARVEILVDPERPDHFVLPTAFR